MSGWQSLKDQLNSVIQDVDCLEISDEAKVSVMHGFMQNICGFTHDVLDAIDWEEVELAKRPNKPTET